MRAPERVAAFLVGFLCLAGTARAQRTDVVRMGNGDRITGEVKKLDRGQLELKTDDVGTIYFEWDKIVSLEAMGQFDVGMSDGRRFLGSLAAGDPKVLVIVEASGPVSVPTAEVTLITPIGTSFWKRLDGSVDVGFSYTRSSQIAQLNVNSTTLYSRPAFEGRLVASGTFTQNGTDGTKDDRASIQGTYLRFRGERLFVAAGAGVETNESLGLVLRTQVGVTAGPRLVNTNRAQLSISGGLSANDEQAVDAESTQNLEGLVVVRTSYYRYDRPRTNLDVSFQYYPSLSNFGRQRIQLDAGAKREFWKDVFLSINMFDTFDSRPPNATAEKNDVGVSLSFGWTY